MRLGLAVWILLGLIMALLTTPQGVAQERTRGAVSASAASKNAKAVDAPRKLPKKSTSSGAKTALPLPNPTDKAVTTVVSGLAIVLGLFLVFAWITKKNAPKSMQALPGEVVEVLGRAPLNAKQQMQLVRLGNRLLLLAMSTESAETLAEISDPNEVERLTAICRQNAPGSVTETFRQVLAELNNTPARGGFIDTRDSSPARARASY